MGAGVLGRILAALSRSGARYIVVGGVAVVLHGHARMTADLDLVLELERENVLRALAALADLGFRPRAPVRMEAFADPRERQSWIDEKGLTVFSLWSPALAVVEVDIFVREPFIFSDAFSRAVVVSLDGQDVHVASIDDLITLKRASGRPQDLDDIRALEAIRAVERKP